jgi:putative redox protein
MNEINVNWTGGMTFTAQVPTGVEFTMDTHPDYGGEKKGPTPLEAFLSSSAACSALDVLGILIKKKQKVTGYRIAVNWERGPEGVLPRPVVGLKITHIVTGENLDEAAVARAVELSDTKYCSVVSTMRTNVKVESTYELHEASPTGG